MIARKFVAVVLTTSLMSFAFAQEAVTPAQDQQPVELNQNEEKENIVISVESAQVVNENEALESAAPTEVTDEVSEEEFETAEDQTEKDEIALEMAKFRLEEEQRIADKVRSTTHEYSAFDVLFETIAVDGGSFLMGSDASSTDQQPVHEVRVSSFEMSRTEVTQKLYEAVLGKNSSGEKNPEYAVDNVSWYDAIVFCNRLSIALGLTPCYSVNSMTNPDYWKYTPQSGSQISGKICIDIEANGFRLPSEAEWEYAAKGGDMGLRFDYKYSGSNVIGEVAAYKDNSYYSDVPGTRYMNELGLYDLSGNLYEWCWDWYDVYTGESEDDYYGPENGVNKVLRGGSWRSPEELCTVTARYSLRPGARYDDAGFRIVRHEMTDEEKRAAARKAKANSAAALSAAQEEEYRKASSKRFAAGGAYSLYGDLDSGTLGNMAIGFFYMPLASNVYWGINGGYGVVTDNSKSDLNVTTRIGFNTPLIFERMCRGSIFLQTGIINNKIGIGAGVDIEVMNMFTVNNFGIGLDVNGSYNITLDGKKSFNASFGLEVLIPNIPKQGM